MLGAVIGDVVGSKYEFGTKKSKQFELFTKDNRITDDTVMTLAIAKAFLDSGNNDTSLSTLAVYWMQKLGRRYPNAGYGERFYQWIYQQTPKPYNSFGNGSAMRVSPCAYAAKSLSEAKRLAKITSVVTHNHPEGVKGAQATVSAIWLAKVGATKREIRRYISKHFYPLHKSIDEIRPFYSFDVTCQGSVPEAIECFLESENFEDSIRNAVSLGGDSDTQAAIAGSIAEAYYGIPEKLREGVETYIPSDLQVILHDFESRFEVRRTL